MAPDQQLRAIAGAMGNISNQAERLRLARQLFGEERGFDFARLLGRGTQGLDEAEARARRFGLVISDSQAEMVARSNRVWSEWSLGLQGIGRSVAVMLAPAWELAGRILGAFFGKISEWVRAAVPYFEMFWGIVQTVIDDVMAFIQPALDWLDGAVNGIGSWIGKMISDVVPMVRQGWNILKSIFSVAWEFIVAGWNALVSFVAPIIQSFVTQVQGWFSALGGFLVGENITTWDQFKDRVLRILITMEFGIRNWQRVGELALNMLRLKFYEWASGLQPIAQAVQSFLNGMIDGFNTVTRGLARTIQSSINGIIDGYNALAQRVGARQISGRINVDARQLGHVNLEIANVEDRIRELRQLVSNQQGELSQDLNAFIQRRMRELTEQRQRAEQTTNNRAAMSQGIEKKDNKAIEKGSVEAFSVIVGDKGDKQFQALNRIVGEMRDANNLNRQQLRELQNRLSIAIARL
jgi:hypothetical protein